MEWTKIPTDLLQTRISDKEILAITKYQLLWAMLERQPTDDICLRYMSPKQLQQALNYHSAIQCRVNADIKSVESNRHRQKLFYQKNQGLTDKPNGYTNDDANDYTNTQTTKADKIREDKNKETTKEKESHYSESFLCAWNKYPKKRIGNKDKAYNAWNKVIKDKRFTEEFLVKAVENYAVSEDATKDDGKWAKGFVAWLNDDRFKQYFSCVEENKEIENLSEMEKYKRGLVPLPPQKEDKWEDFDMFGDKLWGNNK